MKTREADGSSNQLPGLARATTLNLLGSAASALLTVGLLLVVTRGVGQGRAGVFFAGVALFQVLSIASALGTETGLVKWISGRAESQTQMALVNLLKVSLVPVLLTSVLVATVVLFAADPLGRFIGGTELAEEATSVISVMAAFLPLASLSYALLGATRGYGTMKPTVVVDRIGRTAAQVVGVGAALALNASLPIVAIVWCLPYAAELIVSWVWLRRIDLNDRIQTPRTGEVRSEFAPFWRFTLPRSIASIFRATFQWVDVILVAGLASPEQAAIYAVATRLLQIGLLAAFSVGQAVEPRFGKAVAMNDNTTTKNLYGVVTGWLILLTWPIYIVIALFAAAILGIFGEGFEVGATAVVVLCGAVLLGAAVGPVDVLLVMKGKSTWSLWNTGLALAVNLVLNFVLIPRYGVLGAAVSLAASRVIANVLPLAQLFKLADLHPFGRGWATAAVTSAAVFGAAGALARMVLGDDLGAAVVATLVGLAVYTPILIRSRKTLELESAGTILARGGFA